MAYGIENLKKLIGLSLGLAKKVAENLKDKKLTTGEIFALLPDLMQIPDIVKSWDAIKQEIGELDPTERQQLYDYFAATFTIPNAKVEVFIEHAVQNALSLIALVEEFKALKPKTVPPTTPTP